MLQQQHCSKKYMNDAWMTLYDWVHAPKTSKGHKRRLALLTTFSKKDTSFHTVVAKSLWKHANAPNHPWGRAALTPSVYSALPMQSKVMGVCRIYIGSLLGFFFVN